MAEPGCRVLPASEAFWRSSNQMGVLNTDLAELAWLYPDGPRALPPELEHADSPD